MSKPDDITDEAWNAALDVEIDADFSFDGRSNAAVSEWEARIAIARAIQAAEKRGALAERSAHEEHKMALYAKLHALAPHGTCGCSYDSTDDLCAHHSPQIQAAEKRATERERERAALAAKAAALGPVNEETAEQIAAAIRKGE